MRIGLLGAGGIGRVHARQYARRGNVELFIHDRVPAHAAALAESSGGTPVDSFEDVLTKVDAVDVCLPTPLHREVGLRALAAGRAVLMEKPITRTFEEGLELVETAERAGVPLMTAQVVRFFPDFARGHALVESGAVGNPAAARVRRGGKAPQGTEGWFQNLEMSGGVLLDLAIHDFDWLRWTLGEVSHLYSRSVGLQDGHGPDYALTTLTFDSGAVAHVESTWMDPTGFRTTFEIAGSGGLISHDSRNNAFLRTATENGVVTDGGLVPEDDPYYREIDGFVTALENGTPVPVPGREGLAALAISLAAIESATTGRVVKPVRV